MKATTEPVAYVAEKNSMHRCGRSKRTDREREREVDDDVTSPSRGFVSLKLFST